MSGQPPDPRSAPGFPQGAQPVALGDDVQGTWRHLGRVVLSLFAGLMAGNIAYLFVESGWVALASGIVGMIAAWVWIGRKGPRPPWLMLVSAALVTLVGLGFAVLGWWLGGKGGLVAGAFALVCLAGAVQTWWRWRAMRRPQP